MRNRIVIFLVAMFALGVGGPGARGQSTSVKLALLKYGGGGDWYGDPTALTNLIAFCNRELGSSIHRMYLEAGGFLHIDDNYGLDSYIRREMKKVFPEKDFQELPPSHPLFSQKFTFPDGLPKIHEHDNNLPLHLRKRPG